MSDPGGAVRPRVRIGVGAALVVLIVALACAVLFAALAPRGETRVVGDGAGAGSASGGAGSGDVGGGAGVSASAIPGAGIFVHILGAVARPGLYELREGDRAVDAVAAAGGFAAGADQSQLNLARFVTDGEQIVVPLQGEAPTPGGAAPGGAGAGGGATVGGKVNINTADATALETLPRVGPAMAARIIAWRDANGRFAAVEDLMSVTGIGEKTFDAMKDLVTV